MTRVVCSWQNGVISTYARARTAVFFFFSRRRAASTPRARGDGEPGAQRVAELGLVDDDDKFVGDDLDHLLA